MNAGTWITPLKKSVVENFLNAPDLSKSFNYTLVSGNYRLDTIVYTAPSISAQVLTRALTWADFGRKTERVLLDVYTLV